MISLRKQIQDSENAEGRAKALARALVGLLGAVPKTALPANSDVAAQCRTVLEAAAEEIKGEPRVPDIDKAGIVAVEQVDEIYRSNKQAIDERDAALKEVVDTVSWAVSSFRGNGEKHKSNLTKLADGFEALSKVDDLGELRRRLHDEVGRLRETVESMRRESEDSAKRLESQVAIYQERVEQARKDSGIDRLTGLGSRREAERYLLCATKREGSVCLVVFDIEAFRQINLVHGTMFGDKILKAMTHALRERFPADGTLFRWGPDEFLALAEGSLAARLDQAKGICESFASSSYYSTEQGAKKAVNAKVACGAAAYVRGETVGDWYNRAREVLEQHRRTLRA